MARLFVYGTLMVGRPAHGLLAPFVAGALPATVAGRLYLMPEGYPALLDVPEGIVHGELLELSEDLPWPKIDRYEGYDPRDPEGSLYLRARRASEAAGGPLEAWTYVMRAAMEAGIRARGARILPDGRWPPRNSGAAPS